MQRSSKKLLVVALLVMFIGVAAWIFLGNHPAGPFNQDVAQHIVDTGVAAFQSRDVDGVMQLISPETDFLQRGADQMKNILRQTMEELGTTNLKVICTNLQVQPGDLHGSFGADVAVTENTAKSKIVYYKFHININVARQKTPFFYGLGTRESWQITSASAEPAMEMPTVEHEQ